MYVQLEECYSADARLDKLPAYMVNADEEVAEGTALSAVGMYIGEVTIPMRDAEPDYLNSYSDDVEICIDSEMERMRAENCSELSARVFVI